MEVKSRYSVVAELEAKKRGLMAERDGLKKNVFMKEKALNQNLFQYKQGTQLLQRKITDLEVKGNKFLSELEIEKVSLERKLSDLAADQVRFEVEANSDIEYLINNMDTMKESLIEQIASVEENLKRFGMSVKTK